MKTKTKLKVVNIYPTEKVYKMGDGYRHDMEYEITISGVDAAVEKTPRGVSVCIGYYNGDFTFTVRDEVYKSMTTDIPMAEKYICKLYDKWDDILDFDKYANKYMLPCIMHGQLRHMCAYPSKK